MTDIPDTMTSMSQTFLFQEGEDYIFIGTIQYERYEKKNETLQLS